MIACTDCNRVFGGVHPLAQHRADTHDNANWVSSSTTKKTRKIAPLCPMCGEPASLSEGEFGIRAECCGMWSWNYKPLVSRTTHVARIQAHKAFDQVWRSGRLRRGECYRRLADVMGLTSIECHIALMDIDQARRVIDIVRSGDLLKERAAP